MNTPVSAKCQNTGPPNARAATYGTIRFANVLPAIAPPRRSHADHARCEASSATPRISAVPKLADTATNRRTSPSYTAR